MQFLGAQPKSPFGFDALQNGGISAANFVGGSINTNGNNAFIVGGGNVTTNNVTATGSLAFLEGGGNVTANNITADTAIMLASQGSGGSVLVHNITATTFVGLGADGAGSISQTAGGLISTPTLLATSNANGNFGAGTGNITLNTVNGTANDATIDMTVFGQGNTTVTNLGWSATGLIQRRRLRRYLLAHHQLQR